MKVGDQDGCRERSAQKLRRLIEVANSPDDVEAEMRMLARVEKLHSCCLRCRRSLSTVVEVRRRRSTRRDGEAKGDRRAIELCALLSSGTAGGEERNPSSTTSGRRDLVHLSVAREA